LLAIAFAVKHSLLHYFLTLRFFVYLFQDPNTGKVWELDQRRGTFTASSKKGAKASAATESLRAAVQVSFVFLFFTSLSLAIVFSSSLCLLCFRS
jgi:hypothetical protein